MSLLLDTHVVLWWMGDRAQPTPSTRELIKESPEVAISVITGWEISIKQSLGKLRLPDRFRDRLVDEPFTFLDVTFQEAWRAGQLPRHHGDPFDRLLVAQALDRRLKLVTRDRGLAAYGVETIAA